MAIALPSYSLYINHMIKNFALFLALISIISNSWAQGGNPGWSLSILPASVRIDPSSHRIYDQPYIAETGNVTTAASLLKDNWVYNGKKASLQGARGEYVSFQLVLTKN